MTLIRTYQVRFDVDYPLHLLRCLHSSEVSINPPYAVLRFEDSVQLARLIRRAGLSEEILSGDGARRTWIVTFPQLIQLGYTREQLRELAIFPNPEPA